MPFGEHVNLTDFVMWGVSGDPRPIGWSGIETMETFSDDTLDNNEFPIFFNNSASYTMTFETRLSRYARNLLSYGWIKKSPVRKRLLKKLFYRYKTFKMEVV